MVNKGTETANTYFKACLQLHKSGKELSIEKKIGCKFYKIHGNAVYDHIYKKPEERSLEHRNNFIDKWERLRKSYKEILDS